MHCYSATAGSCAESNEMQEINYKRSFLWMHGDKSSVQFYSAGLSAVKSCQLCGDSHCIWHTIVTVFTCGVVCVLYTACEITVCYAISVCKYAYCTTGGWPVICMCGLSPVSAEGEFEKDTIVVEWKFQIQICLPFSSATVVYLYHTLLFFRLIFIHFLPFM